MGLQRRAGALTAAGNPPPTVFGNFGHPAAVLCPSAARTGRAIHFCFAGSFVSAAPIWMAGLRVRFAAPFEHSLAKVGVEGSNPFARSSFPFAISILHSEQRSATQTVFGWVPLGGPLWSGCQRTPAHTAGMRRRPGPDRRRPGPFNPAPYHPRAGHRRLPHSSCLPCAERGRPSRRGCIGQAISSGPCKTKTASSSASVSTSRPAGTGRTGTRSQRRFPTGKPLSPRKRADPGEKAA